MGTIDFDRLGSAGAKAEVSLLESTTYGKVIGMGLKSVGVIKMVCPKR